HDQPMKALLRPNVLASAAALEEDATCIRLPNRADAACSDSPKKADISEPCDHIGLAEIEAALGRLDQGIFGLCTVCGGQISVERLDHNPVSTRCEKCD
ncbi:MAG: hypothetical protein AAFO63_13170, partial [Pseudomonadota bacterium]